MDSPNKLDLYTTAKSAVLSIKQQMKIAIGILEFALILSAMAEEVPAKTARTEATLTRSSQGSDFLAVPPLPASALPTGVQLRKGSMQIDYADGNIKKVTIVKSSGNKVLDEALRQHVFNHYRMRRGASGSAMQPFDFAAAAGKRDGDFSSVPTLVLPKAKARSNAAALITYRDGTITAVVITKSTGNAKLDAQIIEHVLNNFRVLPGRSGKVTIPIRVRP